MICGSITDHSSGTLEVSVVKRLATAGQQPSVRDRALIAAMLYSFACVSSRCWSEFIHS
jgi:hypothetical protein